MANKGKKPEEEAQQTPPPQPIEETETPAIKAINDQYKAAARNIEEGYQRQEEAVTKAYDEQIGGYDTFLGEVGKRKEELSAMDEASQKRAQAYRYIAGIGDAISGVANLVGTAHGAANQQQEYNAPGIMAKAEEQRKARKLEMDQLNERLRELKAQKGALAATRDLKLGELRGKKAAEKAALELQKAEDELGLAKTVISAASRQKVADIRGQYQVETQEEKNRGKETGRSGQPQNQHQFDFGNGEGAVIPKHKWTKAAMAEVYNLIPEEERTRRVRKDQYGLDEKDADGNPVYHTPTEMEMTADIVVAAKKHPEVQAKLKALEKGRIFDTL